MLISPGILAKHLISNAVHGYKAKNEHWHRIPLMIQELPLAVYIETC